MSYVWESSKINDSVTWRYVDATTSRPIIVVFRSMVSSNWLVFCPFQKGDEVTEHATLEQAKVAGLIRFRG